MRGKDTVTAMRVTPAMKKLTSLPAQPVRKTRPEPPLSISPTASTHTQPSFVTQQSAMTRTSKNHSNDNGNSVHGLQMGDIDNNEAKLMNAMLDTDSQNCALNIQHAVCTS